MAVPDLATSIANLRTWLGAGRDSAVSETNALLHAIADGGVGGGGGSYPAQPSDVAYGYRGQIIAAGFTTLLPPDASDRRVHQIFVQNKTTTAQTARLEAEAPTGGFYTIWEAQLPANQEGFNVLVTLEPRLLLRSDLTMRVFLSAATEVFIYMRYELVA